MKYRVTSGKLVVKAESSVHDTETRWDKISGDVDADPAALERATASFRVDMTAFDAGDWLKNRKLRKDFDLDANPAATFQLDRVSEIVVENAKFNAKARGTLRWRGKEVVIEMDGYGKLDDKTLDAHAMFKLDIRKLGLSAPRFFVFKMEDVVTCVVEISGVPA